MLLFSWGAKFWVKVHGKFHRNTYWSDKSIGDWIVAYREQNILTRTLFDHAYLACLVEMVEYWPHFPPFFAFYGTKTESGSIKTKERMGTICSHLDQISVVYAGFIVWPEARQIIYNPKWARQAHFAQGKSSSQSECRVCFILPAHGGSHMKHFMDTPDTNR